MDKSCHNSETYFSYSQYPLLTGSSTHTPSLCSGPIYQTHMPDGGSGSTGVQVKNPKMQILSKTIVDARRKNDNRRRGLNIPSFEEPYGMAYFFCDHESLSDISGSGEGSAKRNQMGQILNFGMDFPQIEPKSVQCEQVEQPLQYPQLIETFKDPEQLNAQWLRKSFGNLVNQNQVMLQKLMQNTARQVQMSGQQSSSAKERQIAAINLQTKTNAKIKKKFTQKSKKRRRKKGMISMSSTMQTAGSRKQRMKIQRKNKSLDKTELCTFWTLTSTCAFEQKCHFAHGIEELRKRIRVCNFKTKPCVDCPRENVKCMFGSRCNYGHPGEALRRTCGSTYFDVDYYKDLRKKFPNNEIPYGIFL